MKANRMLATNNYSFSSLFERQIILLSCKTKIVICKSALAHSKPWMLRHKPGQLQLERYENLKFTHSSLIHQWGAVAMIMNKWWPSLSTKAHQKVCMDHIISIDLYSINSNFPDILQCDAHWDCKHSFSSVLVKNKEIETEIPISLHQIPQNSL